MSSFFQAARKMSTRYGRLGIAEPDDLLQAAMLKLLNKNDGRDANLAWIYRVVHSSAMDAGRQAARERRVMFYDRLYDRSRTDLSPIYERVQPLAGSYLVHEPEQEIDSEIDLEIYLLPRLKDLFSRLSKPHAQVLLLYLEGHSYEEISDLTGVRKGTVRSRLHHARKQARLLFWELAALGELA
ncbi:MAG: RNA polymerase sigma factor [Candidatus Obscuribacterales bacterium]